MALSSSMSLAASGELTSSLDLGTARAPSSFRRAVALTSGTGAGKADRIFSDRRTLAASATEDLDLAGVLLDAFGAAITFVRVKGLYIAAADANVNNVVVGNATANAWATLLSATGTVTLRPGAAVGAMAGAADATAYAVTGATGDLLKIANSGAGTSVTYDIVIIGASA
ncbi:hypothetical protein [Streptomyces chryseus]